MIKMLKKNKVKRDSSFVERRINNSELDAQAIAKGLRRRRDDRLNDLFYYGTICFIIFILAIFAVGSIFVN